jgi:hypothetical protein
MNQGDAGGGSIDNAHRHSVLDSPYSAPSTGWRATDLILSAISQTREDRPGLLATSDPTVIQGGMGEHTEQRITERRRIARKRPGKRTAETMGRRLLRIVVYDKSCRIGATLTLDDLAETEIGDWKMPAFKMACSYAASQGWLIVQDDTLTLTTAGLAAA